VPGGSFRGRELIKGEIELEHVDRGLPEDTPVPTMAGLRNERLDLVEGEAPGMGDAGGLKLRVGQADVRIKTAARGGDRVGRHGGIGGEAVGGAIGGHGGFDTVGELLTRRPEIGAGGAGGIEPVPAAEGRGWKYLSVVKLWARSTEPRTVPLLSVMRLPLAWSVKNAWAPAHTTSG
jgi:hypothetical protein